MSTAAKVELYISKRPYLKEALAEGVINYSALARKISTDKTVASEEAVKIAISRYEDYISEERKQRRDKVESILEETTMDIKPGLKAVKEESENSVVAAKTRNGHTAIVEGGDKALITLESPQSLEETPGVMEFVLSSLAAEGINVNQMISCREDTHLLIGGSKAPDALEILQERL